MAQTILIMAGGTGGHVFPGLAVADCLKNEGWRIVWLGTKTGMENKWVTQHGYDLETIDFSGLRGKSVMTWLMLPLRLLRAFLQSLKILNRVQPDVVLGMGGYPAFPGGMMAALLNKPLVVHEQNAIPGLVNRVLVKLADKVLLGFPDAIKTDSLKIVFSGNPVRKSITQLGTPEQRFAGRSGALKMLVVGGSRGAQVLNKVVPQAIKLMPKNQRPVVIHQAGESNLDELHDHYANLGVTAELKAFIDDMAAQYAMCDLVLCRSGALTVSELAAVGVASILVPYPYAVDDHQTVNAHFLSQCHAAIVLPQVDLNPENLVNILQDMTREKLLAMAIAARKQAKPDATWCVAQACIEAGGVSA